MCACDLNGQEKTISLILKPSNKDKREVLRDANRRQPTIIVICYLNGEGDTLHVIANLLY